MSVSSRFRASFFAALSLIGSHATAQCPGCATDFACTASPAFPTLCPAQPPDATAGQPYQTDITFWLPANFDDPGTGYNVDFEQMTFTGVSGLPFGLQLETNDPAGIYYPQSNEYGCARICGTPLGAGTYTVTIHIIATVTVTSFGFTLNVPQSFPITLVVLPGSGGNSSFIFTPNSGCGSATVQFEALIDGGGQPTSWAWDFGNGTTGTAMIPSPVLYAAPGTYSVNLLTTIGGYVLNTVDLNGVNDNWCGDVEEPDIFGCIGSPDLYFVLTNGSGGQYTSSSGSDSGSESWGGLGLLLDDPPYSIQFYDEDPVSPDDDLGTYNIPLGGAGSYPFTITGGTNGALQIDLVPQLTFSDTDTVVVFAAPSIGTAYDTLAAEICAYDSSVIAWTWFHDGDTVPGTFGSCVVADTAGLWWAVGTNGFGCTGGSDTVVVCPEVAIQQGDAIMYVLGDFDTYQWSLDGTPIGGATGPVIVGAIPGLYTVEVTTAYGCVLTDSTLWLTTSIPDAFADGEVRLFPSPNSGAFTVVAAGLGAGTVALEVLDPRGAVVASRRVGPVNGSLAEPLALDLKAGSYLLRLVAGAERRTIPFMVQH